MRGWGHFRPRIHPSTPTLALSLSCPSNPPASMPPYQPTLLSCLPVSALGFTPTKKARTSKTSAAARPPPQSFCMGPRW